MAEASIKDTLLMLNCVLYIDYLIWFKKNKIQILIDLNSKVNIIILVCAAKLSLNVRNTNIRA